jgi:hypothetical protein
VIFARETCEAKLHAVQWLGAQSGVSVRHMAKPNNLADGFGADKSGHGASEFLGSLQVSQTMRGRPSNSCDQTHQEKTPRAMPRRFKKI